MTRPSKSQVSSGALTRRSKISRVLAPSPSPPIRHADLLACNHNTLKNDLKLSRKCSCRKSFTRFLLSSKQIRKFHAVDMPDEATRRSLGILQRQYFQLVEPHCLRWPEDANLKTAEVQGWLFSNLFDLSKVTSPPPDRYQLRVLKSLVAKLERSIVDPEEDVRPPLSYHGTAKLADIIHNRSQPRCLSK